MTRIGRMLVRLCLLAVVGSIMAQSTHAQDDVAGSSYITPFPEGDIYKTLVVGDAFAEGVLAGLVEAFGSDSRLQITRKHRVLAGLARQDIDDELKTLEDMFTREPNHITVVMVGRDDRTPIRLPGNKRLALGRDEWREEYGRRVDRLMKLLKRRGGAVYWVGLPVVRRPEWNEDIQVMNDLVRERAYLNGIKYVDAFAGFADEGGNYIAEGPDAAGRVRNMRSPDGVGFTEAGHRKLAHFVEREMRRDLTQAKNERSIPLAGAEPEQRKINPAKAAADQAQAAAAAAPKAIETKSALATTTTPGAPLPVANSAAGTGEQKADLTKVSLRTIVTGGREETATLDILRPAIAASVIQLMARNASPDRATQVGDTLQESLPGGLTLLSSISPASEVQTVGRRTKLAPTQTAYFKVIVKGERLPAKPGRADDFRWPRPDQIVEPPPVSAPVRASAPSAQSPPPATPPAAKAAAGQRPPTVPRSPPPKQ